MKTPLLMLISLAALVVTATEQPNVLFIAIDDLKPTLGCYDDSLAKTPNIDRLAARGMVFANNHCQQAVCGPSRASLMTGLRPDSTRVWDLKTKIRDMRPDVVTLPQHFKDNGYTTAGMGKIYDPRSIDSYNQQDKQSWSLKYQMPKVKGNYLDPALKAKEQKARKSGELAAAEDRKAYTRDIGLRPVVECLDVPDESYFDGALTPLATARLDALAKEDKPFFLAVGFKKPHLPFVAPKKYWDLYDRAAIPLASWQKPSENGPEIAYHESGELRSYSGVPLEGAVTDEALQREMIHGYYACVSYIDAQVGTLLGKLEANGQADNTIIVLWGDHGWHLGDHGMWCKHSNFEQATRSPLIIAAPGFAPGVTQSPTEFVDIFPTLCDLGKLKAPETLQGNSLVPILKDPAASVKAVAVSQFPRGGRSAIMGYSMRSERYRLTQWVDVDYRAGKRSGKVVASELYDYEKDPLETRNLIDEAAYASVRQDLETTFAKGWKGKESDQ